MQYIQQKHLSRIIQLLFFVLFCVIFVNAIAETNTAEAKAADTKVAKTKATTDGAVVYRENCAICHGDNGDANTRAQNGLRPPPRNFTTVEAALELSRERMIMSVTDGRPGTGMMSHKDRLSVAEIEAVVDFVRDRFMRTPTQSEAKFAAESKDGKAIYEKNCSVCHGDKGNTAVWAKGGLNPPPRDFTTAEAKQMLTRQRMIKSVTEGRPGTGMMPFASKFSAEEIASVVDYVRSNLMHVDESSNVSTATERKPTQEEKPQLDATKAASIPNANMPHQESKPHQGNGPHAGAMPMMPAPGMQSGAQPGMPTGHTIDADMSLPLPNNLIADVKWGREFYMKNCYVCHGIKGQGDGPRAHFNIPRPRNFTSEDSRRILNRPRIFDSITKGRVATVMPAWSKVLNNQQIANLSEFVFEAFIQPDKFDALPTANKGTAKGKKKAP